MKDERLAKLAGQLDVPAEVGELVGSRREAAVIVEAGLTDGGDLRLDRQEELVEKLKEALEERADTQRLVYLKADSELPYAEVMKVMDLLREAGVEEVALIAEPKVQG